jgi:hypothetical protein
MKPIPSLPKLAARPTTEKLGHFVDSWRFLIRGMGDRAEEIAARFFKQLDGRGIEGLGLYTGQVLIEIGGGRRDSRQYYFAERDLGNSALVTMAVRIAPTGKDLFVEWRHYTTPPKGAFSEGTFMGISALGVIIGIVLSLVYYNPFTVGSRSPGLAWCLCLVPIVIAVIIGATAAAGKARKPSLEGFQSQDSTAFQMSVRAALEEAIDLAGISKALIQELPKEDGEGRRLI